MGGVSESVFELIDLSAHLRELGSAEPESLLVLLHLSSQGTDLPVALLHEGVQSLALLREDGHLVLALCARPLSDVVAFEEAPLELLVLCADQFELVLQLAHLPSRQSQVLLRSSHLLVEVRVFRE